MTPNLYASYNATPAEKVTVHRVQLQTLHRELYSGRSISDECWGLRKVRRCEIILPYTIRVESWSFYSGSASTPLSLSSLFPKDFSSLRLSFSFLLLGAEYLRSSNDVSTFAAGKKKRVEWWWFCVAYTHTKRVENDKSFTGIYLTKSVIYTHV